MRLTVPLRAGIVGALPECVICPVCPADAAGRRRCSWHPASIEGEARNFRKQPRLGLLHDHGPEGPNMAPNDP